MLCNRNSFPFHIVVPLATLLCVRQRETHCKALKGSYARADHLSFYYYYKYMIDLENGPKFPYNKFNFLNSLG